MLLLTGLVALAVAIAAVVYALSAGRPEKAVARTLKTVDSAYRPPARHERARFPGRFRRWAGPSPPVRCKTASTGDSIRPAIRAG